MPRCRFSCDFGETKKTRKVRTSRMHRVSCRDLIIWSENEGFCFRVSRRLLVPPGASSWVSSGCFLGAILVRQKDAEGPYDSNGPVLVPRSLHMVPKRKILLSQAGPHFLTCSPTSNATPTYLEEYLELFLAVQPTRLAQDFE